MKIKNFFLLLVCFLFLGTCPAFSDGGIPLWLWTAQDIFGFEVGSLIHDRSGNFEFIDFTAFIIFCCIFIIIPLILLSIVILVEIGVFKLFLKKIENWKNILKAIIFGNIVSTILGSMLFCIVLLLSTDIVTELYSQLYGSHNISFIIVGPYGILGGIGFLIHNLYYFIISYYSEYYVGRKYLKYDYEDKKIKKAFLLANIVTYTIPFIVSILFFLDADFIKIYSLNTELFIKYCNYTLIIPFLIIVIGVAITEIMSHAHKKII